MTDNAFLPVEITDGNLSAKLIPFSYWGLLAQRIMSVINNIISALLLAAMQAELRTGAAVLKASR